MCSRFILMMLFDELKRIYRLQLQREMLQARYNVAPTQQIPVIIRSEDSNVLTEMRWGLIPFWAKDEKIGNKMINARAESIAEKPSFKKSFFNRRCLIPSNGFYEWKREGKSKLPFLIMLKNEEPFSFAGLWDSWKNKEGKEIQSCTIITCPANSLVEEIHNRMPVVLKREDEDLWLDPAVKEADKLLKILTPYPANQMKFYQVSSLVNSPRVDVKECVLPVEKDG